MRASLAQELYAGVFGWLTQLVGKGIAPLNKANTYKQIGLLDLYGFEVFSSNGFEQFLINYCNERLQQFFNRQVFTHEAEEYAAEGLDTDGQWARLTAACQLPAIALLEGQPGSIGIFGVINDRSKTAFEDSNLPDTLAKSCGGHIAFCKAGKNASRVFGIKHFAGEVFYEAEHFVRKNASAHRPDIYSFFKDQKALFAREVLGGEAAEAEREAAAAGGPRRRLFGKTLISTFQQELNELCANLEARQCRHVRCLRPNDEQKPLEFDDVSMLRQCRYSGLLEATRIRKQGFAHRRAIRTFAARFAMLLQSREARRAARRAHGEQAAALCAQITEAACVRGSVCADDIMIGRTKVFMREAAMSWFEKSRTNTAVAAILALMKGNLARQIFLRKKYCATKVQALLRGVIARRRFSEHVAAQKARKAAQAVNEVAQALLARQQRAATKLQASWRKRLAQRHANEVRLIQQARHSKVMLRPRRPTELEDVAKNLISPAMVARSVQAVPAAIVPGAHLYTVTTTTTTSPTGVKVTRTVTPGSGVARPLALSEDLLNQSYGGHRISTVIISPTSLHEQCLQECTRLLMEHQQVKMPSEHLGLLGELVEETNFLNCHPNPAMIPAQRLLDIRERNRVIKALLKSCGGAPSRQGSAPVAVGAASVTDNEGRARRLQRQPSGMIPTYSFAGIPQDRRQQPEFPRSLSARAVIRAPTLMTVRPATARTSSVSSLRPARTVVATASTVNFTPRNLAPSTYAVMAPPPTVAAVPVASSGKQWAYGLPVVGKSTAVEAIVAKVATPCRSSVRASTVKSGAPPPTIRPMSPSPAQIHRAISGLQSATGGFAPTSSYSPSASPVLGGPAARLPWSGQTASWCPPPAQTTPWLMSRGLMGSPASPATCSVSLI